MSAPAISTATSISTKASTCSRASGGRVDEAELSRDRSGRTRSPRTKPTNHVGERDQLTHDTAHEREERRQRDDADDRDVEAGHRRDLRAIGEAHGDGRTRQLRRRDHAVVKPLDFELHAGGFGLGARRESSDPHAPELAVARVDGLDVRGA